MTRAFFKYTITVERLVKEAGVNKESYAANGSIYGVVMSLSPEDTMLTEGNPATSAVLNCEAQSDIRIGDRITCNGSTYIVKSVKTPLPLFSVAVKRCVVEKMVS